MRVTVKVNLHERTADVEPRLLLVDFLREDLGLVGTHVGCEHGVCGTCTVLMDGESIRSCVTFAVQADGRSLTTVEGLASGAQLSPIQIGFHEEHGLQCGFCTPGMMLVGSALLDRNPDPTEDEIRWAISGNICRCTGYVNIVKAIRHAARLQADRQAVPTEAPVAAATSGGE